MPAIATLRFYLRMSKRRLSDSSSEIHVFLSASFAGFDSFFLDASSWGRNRHLQAWFSNSWCSGYWNTGWPSRGSWYHNCHVDILSSKYTFLEFARDWFDAGSVDFTDPVCPMIDALNFSSPISIYIDQRALYPIISYITTFQTNDITFPLYNSSLSYRIKAHTSF